MTGLSDLLTVENVKKGFKDPISASRFLIGQTRRLVLYYYYGHDEYYLKRTKSDVHENPAGSVGPEELYDEMQEWQISYLKDHGLSPNDYFLDIGCGVLRGGIPIIEYLNSERYYGMDISSDALDVAQQEIDTHDLGHNNPTLINNSNLRFSENEFEDIVFDIIWAQSVITHLPEDKVDELLANVGKILAEEGSFHATIWESDRKSVQVHNSLTDFSYSISYLDKLAEKYHLTATRVESDHPNDLQTVRFDWKNDSS